MADKKLQIILTAVDKTDAAFNKLGKKLKNTQVMSTQTANNLKKISVAGIGLAGAIGTKAVVAAASFEKSMGNISTLVDTTTESMEKMGKEVLKMSTEVAVAPEELTAALYDVRSAGIAASGAMDVLRASGELAVSGLGTTQEATNVLTSAINAFGLDATKATEHADVFFKAVKSGKTTVAGLSQGFGTVAPLANSLGVQFEELMAITSAMTTSGLAASVAYTQQKAVMSNLLKPTKDMAELYKELDITNIQSTITNDGLQKTIVRIAEATDGNNEMLAKAFGSVEGLNAVMMLMNETGTMSTEIYKDMTEGANAMDEAVKKQNATTAAQYQLMKNKLNVELVKLGVVIIPKLVSGMEASILILKEWKLWFDKAADALGSFIFNVQQGWEAVTKLSNKISNSKISQFITGGKGGIPGIPFFAEGGIVTKPTLGVVGESGPEAVIPLNKAGKGLGGGITVNVYGDVSGEELIEKVKVGIMNDLSLNNKMG